MNIIEYINKYEFILISIFDNIDNMNRILHIFEIYQIYHLYIVATAESRRVIIPRWCDICCMLEDDTKVGFDVMKILKIINKII